MISVSLSEWITWLQQHERTALASFLALALFLGLYGVSERKMARKERSRLDHLRISLELFSAAAGPLMRKVHKLETASYEEELLSDRLLACRAAPYITADLLVQIGAYINDQDPARLPLLQKTLERESERLIEERENLLSGIERPSWGQSLWQQVRPILPFLFASALLFCFGWLFKLIIDLSVGTTIEGRILLNNWTCFVSVIFSLLLLYPALMGGRRKVEGAALLQALSIFIALISLIHWISLDLSPYILGAQALLFFVGFVLAGNKPRRSRPFAGHYDQMNNESTGRATGDLPTDTESESSTN